ncbi:hypothetical protein F5Y18DRAFT_8650 [Xylariaceae sp. FL1019]|nr:hypothetical protein F5Y18DRAFT_8650 [Xylariaceae sp. FL1019]
MPARSAVSILAAPAPTPRQCLLFLYPPSLLYKPSSSLISSYSSYSTPLRCKRSRARKSPLRSKVNGSRNFHTTTPSRDEAIDNARNHYETLKVPPGATPAEIKKSFYTLSKTHHPDLQPASSRPLASKRFMRISEAYAILSHPTKRQKYDREHFPSSSPHPRGSYSSTNPAGGRPASGLSRRRGTFTGPPPSFFRNGTYGNYGGKRRNAHDESTGGAEHRDTSGHKDTNDTTANGGTYGGMGPGQSPFHNTDTDVPHFDRQSHERTGHNLNRQRAARRAASQRTFSEPISIEPEKGVGGMFFVIGSVLLVAALGPFMLFSLGGGTGSRAELKRSRSNANRGQNNDGKGAG